MELLPGLDTFLLVARLGSTSAAARELGVPRSTVSRRVGALERHLGQTLLLRNSRGIRLTEAGNLVVDGGRSIVAALKALENSVRELGEGPRGTLRIATPPGLGTGFMGEFLKDLHERWPLLRVEIHIRETPPDLVDEAFDILVLEGPLTDSPWFARMVAVADRLVVASPEYLEKHGEPNLADLDRHSIIALATPGSSAHSWPLLKGGTVPVSPILVTSDYQTVVAAALNSVGLALLPQHSVLEELAVGRFVPVLPEVGRGVSLFAVTAHRKSDQPKLRAFFSLVDEFATRYEHLTPPVRRAQPGHP